MTGWVFPGCPDAPDWTIDWAFLEARYPILAELADCPQDREHHAEGDVLVHTRRVCEALVADESWRAEPEAERRSMLFAAALFHDLGKPRATRLEVGGKVTARGHARLGARMARLVLWDEADRGVPTPFSIRERVVGLVLHHGLPLTLLLKDDPRRAFAGASQVARADDLARIAEADVRGRESHDTDDLVSRVRLFREFATEEGCLSGPRAFPSDHSRFLYFQGTSADIDRLAFDDTKREVVVLSGVPGAGKDHWVERLGSDLPVLSLDAVREELAVSPEGDQARVVEAARERARVFLRAGRSFIWNATHTTREIRGRAIALAASYRARIRVVYVEAPFQTILARNRRRAKPVPERVIRRLAERLDVPDLTEAHQVDFAVEELA